VLDFEEEGRVFTTDLFLKVDSIISSHPISNVVHSEHQLSFSPLPWDHLAKKRSVLGKSMDL
jgi:hypothetical protein